MKYYLIIGLVSLMVYTSCARRAVTPAPQSKIVVIKTPPRNHKVVVIKGQRYYKWNGRYHRKTKNGYIVVKH